jgi:outer membrane lipoprotein-sorting protein
MRKQSKMSFRRYPLLLALALMICSSEASALTGEASALTGEATALTGKASALTGEASVISAEVPVSELTASEIIRKIDDNMFSDSQWMKSRMIVINRRGRKREMVLESWIVGDDKAFSEYLAPKRDRGTKMLKTKKNIWTYTPQTDRIIHIAGHLLKQSVMGSDLSYEDSMEEIKLSESYNASIIRKDKFQERDGWMIELTARTEGLAYPLRRVFVDCERFVPLREERYGKSGRLLKTMTVRKVERIEGRWFPVNCLYKDELKDGQGTEFIVDEIRFNPEISDSLFTRESLRR